MSCAGQETLPLYLLDFNCLQAVLFWNKKDVKILFRINLLEIGTTLLNLFTLDLWFKPSKIRMFATFLHSMKGTGLSLDINDIVGVTPLIYISNVT